MCGEMKTVCVSCGREYKVHEIGVQMVELTADPKKGGVPYKLFSADVSYCPGCNHKIIHRHGGAMHYHKADVKKTVDRLLKNDEAIVFW